MCRFSATLSSDFSRLCKHILTAFSVIALLVPNLRCNPVPCKEVHLSCQPFAKYIRNPCQGVVTPSLSEYTEEEILAYRMNLLNQIRNGLSGARKDAEKLLNQDEDSGCKNDFLSSSITGSSLQNKGEKEALMDVHASLLIHTTRVHYAFQQHVSENGWSCDNTQKYKTLLADLSEVNCQLRSALLAYSVEESIIDSHSDTALDMVVCNNRQCSKKILEDCDALLDAFQGYLQHIQEL